MKKIKNHMINHVSNPLLKNILITMILSILFMSAVLIKTSSEADFWNKILATCYVVAIMTFLAILGNPGIEKNSHFNQTNSISFLTWCCILPLIVGLIISGLIIKKISSMPISDSGFWSMAICITIFSYIWFLIKLKKEKDVTSYLDLYSTAWIAVLTILTTLFDLHEKKAPFVFLLAMYFGLQLFIKGRTCKIQEKQNDGNKSN